MTGLEAGTTEQLGEALEAAGVRWVRVLWCDNANVIRAKAFNATLLDSRYADGVGIAEAQMAIPVMYDGVVGDSGLTPVGEVRLRPDWKTLAILPFAPGQAQVVGDMVSAEREWPGCPRAFLRRQVAAAGELGLDIAAAFENEFFLLRGEPDAVLPADETVFAATLAFGQSRKAMEAILAALESQGVLVEQFHPEAGPGQHELAIRYDTALAAADRQILVRETVRGVALDHGLRACFLPKPFENAAGSGCHLNLSLWQHGRNVTGNAESKHGLSGDAQAFLAGILDHLPALMAVTTPSTNSYRRIRPHFWSGAFRVWGIDNREAAIRVPRAPDGSEPRYMELKVADASANPYLALGATIAAGLDGVRRKLVPTAPLDVDPGSLSEADRDANSVDPLPRNLGEAIARFRKDAVLNDALGPTLARSFVAVRGAEWAAMKEMSFEEEVALLLERY